MRAVVWLRSLLLVTRLLAQRLAGSIEGGQRGLRVDELSPSPMAALTASVTAMIAADELGFWCALHSNLEVA
jgi:hypothetical protein